MSTTPAPAPSALPREVIITRTVAIPRALVWQAWTTAAHLARWWGPHGFTNPVCTFDAREGGAIRIHMQAGDGTLHQVTGRVLELVEGERLVFLSVALGATGQPLFEVRNTITLREQAGKTILRLHALGGTPGTGTAVAYLDGLAEGWIQSLERLNHLLAALASGQPATTLADPSTPQREIVTERVYAAPRALVFAAFTDPAHISRWWGPVGFSTTTHHMDLRAGGQWRFVMHGPDGRDYQNLITYMEVVPGERLVYQHSGDDEENLEPVRFWVMVRFVTEGSGTRVILRSVFGSVAERDRVEREYGAVEGARQTLARLAEHLSAR